jgi:hypothetical protein
MTGVKPELFSRRLRFFDAGLLRGAFHEKTRYFVKNAGKQEHP